MTVWTLLYQGEGALSIVEVYKSCPSKKKIKAFAEKAGIFQKRLEKVVEDVSKLHYYEGSWECIHLNLHIPN